MTRKDYVALAEALHAVKAEASTRFVYGTDHETWFACVLAVAGKLQADNSRFDYQRFVKACEGEK